MSSSDKFKKARDVFSANWLSSSPVRRKLQKIRSRSNPIIDADAQASSSAAHSSTRSVDVQPPRTAASASSGAANSVKLVSGADEVDHSQSTTHPPMPNAVSNMTISGSISTDSKNGAQARNHSNGDNFSGGPLQRTDHNDLALRTASNGNQNQKSYNMAPATSSSPPAHGSFPAGNGAYSNSDRLPLPRGATTPISTVRALSGQFGGARSQSNLREMNNDSASANSEWSSAVGGATTSGKSGRMIEKLMSERDTLRREKSALEAEKMELLRERAMAEELAENAQAKFAQELHEASTNSLLLKKRDRKVRDLQEKLEIERARAESFQESERVWKRELDKVKQESISRIAKAEDEARQNEVTIKIYQDTWKEKNQMIDKTRTKLNKDAKQHIQTVVAHADTLQQRDQIYEQSSKGLDELVEIQKQQAAVFADFKTKIDEDLSELKTQAARRKNEAELLQSEVKETCNKMAWVMNVKKNVSDAQ